MFTPANYNAIYRKALALRIVALGGNYRTSSRSRWNRKVFFVGTFEISSSKTAVQAATAGQRFFL